MVPDLAVSGPKWVTLATHRAWLLAQAERLFAFFEKGSVNPSGGFYDLDDEGRPLVSRFPLGGPPVREIHSTCRMVHCFAIAQLMGRPGADAMIDHGMRYLWSGHRDAEHGGYFWAVSDDGPLREDKQAYGHAFVLLAASSAKVAGHPDADRLLADVTEIIKTRFWEADPGASAEEFTRDWQPLGRYRGQNSNMHLTEACMAAFEATGEQDYLDMAVSIAELIIRKSAANNGWRLPEHFDETWRVDLDYEGDPMFRPYGSTPGHWLEWARLIVQLWELGGRRDEWSGPAAQALFRRSTREAWDAKTGGFYYTVDWQGRPRVRGRYWWPCAEGIGAAAFLNASFDDPLYEEWYRRIWNWTAANLIDHEHGGWRPQVDDRLRPSVGPFVGKPDIYHALQACLIPLLPATGSITRGLRGGGGISLSA